MKTITGNLDLRSMKRFQIPGTFIDMKCLGCGENYQIEMIDQIEYPDDNDHFISVECEECGAITERKIDIDSVIVTLKIHERTDEQ